MAILKEEIEELIAKGELVIKPLLDRDQIGQITIDFRIGHDFLVSIQGREPYINASRNGSNEHPISHLFQPTRRAIGSTFLLHPNQTILASSVEYVKLPQDLYMVLNMRSSYLRLGITASAIVQPGYCGCLSLELTNTNKNPINLTVGAALVQGRLIRISKPVNYFRKPRKYMCQVRPQISAANDDSDLEILHNIWIHQNHLEI